MTGVVGLAALLLVPWNAAATAAPEDGPFEVVAKGLDNPRGIAIGSHKRIYVAEAGRGGSRCATSEGPEGEEELCLGRTGAITEIADGKARRVVRNLPSVAGPDGSFAGGAHDVSVRGSSLHISMGRSGAQLPPEFGDRAELFGKILEAELGGPVNVLGDTAAVELNQNPDGEDIVANNYGLLARPGERDLVLDAGGNDLLRLGPKGVEVVAVFPPQMVDAPPFLGLPPGTQIPAQSVPTGLTRGPDGAFYVGELTGFPFPVGKARVWRVVPGQAPQVFATGFTNIIDVTFGPDGNLFVLELKKNGLLQDDPTGALIKVAPDGTRTEVASQGLVFPGGVAVDDDGTAYVTNFSVFPKQGQVVKIPT